jgi:hypothetical protein
VPYRPHALAATTCGCYIHSDSKNISLHKTPLAARRFPTHVWPGVLNYATLAAALACNDLPNNHGFRALIVMMCSEAARSKLVERFVRSVLNGGADADAYATVRGLTAQYGHTQIHTGGQVANGPGWAPLETHHHLNYALHQRDVLKVVNLFEGIHGVNSFANQHL